MINILAAAACHATADDAPYTVPDKPWPEQQGLHRAVVEVAAPADAVRVRLPWRRRDEPAGKRILIVNGQGKAVRNVFRVSVGRWKADLVIGPATAAGTYHVYYLPFTIHQGWGGYGGSYLPPGPPPDAAWVKKHGLGLGVDPAGLPEAKLLAFQSRTAFDSFWPMEIPATPEETRAVIAKGDSPFLVFPEDRCFPIRMPEAIPTRWLEGPYDTFRGEALRNEYFTFQVGVFAARQALEGLTVTFTDLKNGDAVLPAGALTCFNTGGIDCYGKRFAKTVSVPQGRIQPLWIGVDVPRDAEPGACVGGGEDGRQDLGVVEGAVACAGVDGPFDVAADPGGLDGGEGEGVAGAEGGGDVVDVDAEDDELGGGGGGLGVLGVGGLHEGVAGVGGVEVGGGGIGVVEGAVAGVVVVGDHGPGDGAAGGADGAGDFARAVAGEDLGRRGGDVDVAADDGDGVGVGGLGVAGGVADLEGGGAGGGRVRVWPYG